MNIIPTGNFEVKLEFEDDSFELTNAELKSDGTFSCESLKASDEKPFKMVFVDNDDSFHQFECKVEDRSHLQIYGKLSKLSFE